MKQYKCPTLGDCDKANSGQIFEKEMGDDLHCPGCNTMLVAVESDRPPKGGNKKPSFIIAGVLALVCIVAVGAYFASHSSKNDTTSPIGTENAKSEKPDVTIKADPARSGATLASILSNRVVRVSAQYPSRPFFYHDNRGIAKGFNVDFMKTLFAQSEFGNQQINLDTSHEVDAYEKVPLQLLQGNSVDIAIDGLTFNDDDLKGVVYTIPYVKDFGYALIAQRNSAITSVGAANGKTIGVLKGDPDAMAFAKQAFPKSHLVELADKADENGKWIVGYIDSHKVDAVMYDYPFSVPQIEDTDMQFVSPKIVGSELEYKIGVRAMDKDLLDALNSAIRKVIASDAYTVMLKTYLMSNKIAAVQVASSSEKVYVVVRGDTLSNIAQIHLGNKMRYPEIQSRNNIANPNFISVGNKLIIPK